MKQTQPLSACCNSPTYTSSGCDDDILHGGKPCTCEVGTMYFICSKCSKPCDIATPELSSCCGEPIKTGIESSAIGCIKYRRCTRCDEDCDIATPPTSGDELEKEIDDYECRGVSCPHEMTVKHYIFDIDEIRNLIRAEREKVLEDITKGCSIRKPTHGICCTCQTCGQDKDDCYCDYNFKVVLKNLNAIREKLQKDL